MKQDNYLRPNESIILLIFASGGAKPFDDT